MKYKTPAALEMAVKAAASASLMETGAAVAAFYRHRLLCRVFSTESRDFILKGGQGVLARVIDARATRDIDLLSQASDVQEALSSLRALSEIDLGDFVTFEFAGASPIKTDDEYRDGVNVEFRALLGERFKGKVAIDLVIDSAFADEPDMLAPADRLDIPGLPVCDYPVYPIPNALADKVCGVLEMHDGHASSRVKDLVDILVYAQMQGYDGAALCDRVARELRIRKMEDIREFNVPTIWHEHYRGQYRKLARSAHIDGRFPGLEAAEAAAKQFFDPLLTGEATGKTWDPDAWRWS